MNGNLFLIILSPFTAFIPLFKLLTSVITDRCPIHLTRYNICLLGMFIWSLFSSAINKDWLSTMASFAFLLYFAITVWIQSLVPTERQIEGLVHKLWKLSLVPAFMGIVERLLAFFIDFTWMSRFFWNPTYVPSRTHYRIFTTFGNPNVAADWFAVMFFVSLYFMEKTHSKRHRYLYGGAGLLFGLDLFLTGSKGAFLGAFAALILYGFLKKSRMIWGLFGVVSVMSAVILLFVPDMISIVNPRNRIWVEALNLFQARPVTGWGMMGLFQEIQEVHAHNIWLGILSALGGIGLILYLEMRWYVIEGLFLLFESENPLAPLLIAIQLLLVIHGIFDFTIMAPQVGILFFGSCACINVLARPVAVSQGLPALVQQFFIKQKAV